MNFKIDVLSVWEKLQQSEEPIVMYGTGNGADKVCDMLKKTGTELSGVTASSGFVRERIFRNFPVKPLEYFEEKYGNFTVIITFGTSIPAVMENIYNISSRHRTLVPCVPVIGTEVFDRHFTEKHKNEINEAHSLLADEISKKVFESYVNFQFGGELSHLKNMETAEDDAYRGILKLTQTESFVDIGAYRGDTVEYFLKLTEGKYSDIIAAEPDRKTFSKLMANCGNLKNFRAVNAAVTEFDGTLGFSALSGRQSAVGGDTVVDAVSLPTLCDGISPSFIKIDSEGCEELILRGGEKILKEHKPKLNVAAYHKSEDIFKIPLLINSINPEYKLFLRHHPYIPAWDTLFYCI